MGIDAGSALRTERQIIVGVASLEVSNDPETVLVTYALGSCLGIAVYDPVVHVGGLAHVMLPDSGIENNRKSNNTPAKYINTGVPLLFKKMYELGAQKQRIRNAVIGGAQVVDDNNYFNIGKRNVTALRKLYWKNNVLIHKKHVGGRVNRTVRLQVSTGRITVKLGSGEILEL